MCRRHYELTSDDSPKLHNEQLPWQGLRAKRNKCHKTYPSLLLQAFIYAQQGYLKILAEESPHFYILWIFLCEYRKWLVRQKGLEPPTYWFVASHNSSLLSDSLGYYTIFECSINYQSMKTVLQLSLSKQIYTLSFVKLTNYSHFCTISHYHYNFYK